MSVLFTLCLFKINFILKNSTLILKFQFYSESWNLKKKYILIFSLLVALILFCCNQLSIVRWTFISRCWYFVAGGNLCLTSLFITRAGAARRWVAAAGPDKRRPAERAQAALWCKSSRIYGNNNLKTSGSACDAVGREPEPRSEELGTGR